LIWEELRDNKMSRIKYQLDDVNFYIDEDLHKMNHFFLENLILFYDAFNPVIQGLKKK
jgi:hypothetical protein